MTGEALFLVDEPWPEAPPHLVLFASILLCRPIDPPDPGARGAAAAAYAEAVRTIASGRAGVERTATEAFRLLYERNRDRASVERVRTPVPDQGPQWQRCVRALYGLRHRQRAALAVRYVAGFGDEATATILGVRPLEARRVVESAVVAVSRLVGGPVDVRRALRKAGARATLARRMAGEPAPAQPDAGSAPVPALARPVVRKLVAPTPPPDVRPAPARVPKSVVRRRRLAAAACLVLATVLVPVSARVAERPTAGPAAVPQAAQPERAALTVAMPEIVPAPTVTVVRGDTLWEIAARELGNPYAWTAIWARNRNRVMRGAERFTDPDLIKPGWVLRLPS